LEDIQADVTEATRSVASRYLSFDDLAHEVMQHVNSNQLHKVLPDRSVALGYFGEVLALSPILLVGELDGVDDDLKVAVGAWLNAFGTAYDLMPALRVLASLPLEEAALVWEHLKKPVNLNRTLEYLAYLQERHAQEGSMSMRAMISNVHDAYLQLAVTCPDWELGDDRLKLLSQAGSWCSPRELCYSQFSVDKRFLLDARQAQIIEADPSQRADHVEASLVTSVLPRSPEEWRTIEAKLEQTARTLQDYFTPWRGHVKDELIGGFLALLGDDARVRQASMPHARTSAPFRKSSRRTALSSL
jgi:hypothetical protein